MPVGTWCRPGVPGDLCLGPSACGVHQQSSATWALVQVCAGLTSFPGRLGPWSKGPRCRPAFAGNSVPCPRVHMVDQISQAPGPVSEGPWGRPAVLGDSCSLPKPADTTSSPWCLGPMPEVPRGRLALPGVSGQFPSARRVHQQSRSTRSCVQGPAVSTRCPGLLSLLSDGPRCPPALPGDSGL